MDSSGTTLAKIGRYTILRKLGEGAMGSVFLADDPQIERKVAIKIIRPEAASSAVERREIEGRFLREARIVGRLAHPNIVAIWDVGSENGLPFIAMELVEGESLSERMRAEPPMPVGERVRIVRDVALALAHAHGKGVVHRDVKPGNVLVARDGHVKVTDFGIGKVMGQSTEMTRTGMIVGSPAYMSPEQVKGEGVDARSDVFSLGVVLYELLAGVRPFPADTITTLVYQILHVEPPDPATLRPEIPPAISALLRRTLSKPPGERMSSAEEMAAELTKVLATLGGTGGFLPLPIPSAPRPTEGASVASGVAHTQATRILASPVEATSPTRIGSVPPPVAPAGPPEPDRRKTIAVIAGAGIALALGVGWFLTRGKSVPEVPIAPPTAAPSETAGASPLQPVAPTDSTALPAPADTMTVAPPATAATAAPATTAAAATSTARPRPAATAAGRTPAETAPAPAPAPPPPPAEPARDSASIPGGTFVASRSFKVDLDQEQARLYLDGKPIGIADDWDGFGGGAKLVPPPGRHVLRASLPGHVDLSMVLEISPGADDDEVAVTGELSKGGAGGNFPKVRRPEGSTRGVVLFDVKPPTTTVTVDGNAVGTAGDYASSPLVLKGGPRVAEIVLKGPSGKTKTLRVVVSSSGDESLKISEKVE